MRSDWSRITSCLTLITSSKVIIYCSTNFQNGRLAITYVSEEATNKMKENTVASINNLLSNRYFRVLVCLCVKTSLFLIKTCFTCTTIFLKIKLIFIRKEDCILRQKQARTRKWVVIFKHLFSLGSVNNVELSPRLRRRLFPIFTSPSSNFSEGAIEANSN